MDDAYILENIETLSLISDTDEKGIPWTWYVVKDEMRKYGLHSLNSHYAMRNYGEITFYR